MRIRALLLVPVAVVVVACSSSPTVPPAVAAAAATAAAVAAATADDAATTTGDTASPAANLEDPCQKLTKADVQPFFTQQLVTELPGLLQSDTDKSCEFASNNEASSLIVDYEVGDAAQTKVLLHNQPGGDAVSVPGVGDAASHPAGDPSMLFSSKGSGASAVVCTVTTTGLGFALVSTSSAMTDDQATQIDAQYGTLCNKMYGSGNTTPTVPSVSVVPASTLPSDTGAALADSGNTMPGTGIPLPAGVDCSGANTAKDSLLGLSCNQPITDPQGVYTFYLKALPAHGYTISNQAFYPAKDGSTPNGRITFTDTADGLCFISIIGNKLSVSKQEN